MYRINSIKGEVLLQRSGLSSALSFFDTHNKHHPVYTRDFSLNVVGLSHDILTLTSERLHIDHNLLAASLFLRIVAVDNLYSMPAALSLVKVFGNTSHKIDGSSVTSFIRDQETPLAPMTDKGKILHDAEILTFFAQSPEVMIGHVCARTGQHIEEAVNNLVNVAVNQRMHTSVGRSMLIGLSDYVIRGLKGVSTNVERGP
ncbi:hypothetical protein YOLOSWAG_206 [Erwinia phage vB_EamM_Yoloswag]|uniref:Uncharacterized protein n=1 Tax=Erwinia phage vB_EamM_Yoloswag TaxID=1958956 RepID=A0A1S6L3C4_9CAUD|nr:hypothetical protein HOR66_gp206 [Erwinia phage vB_EamM_Yoloswag]AQT28684.1 hypothetical protein YOLOSWAG_206 [Erwinia phage vB_EamM_Yoloswag]